jgi:hypothetical protein
MTTPPSTGSDPPDRPVPDPRATHGTPARWQARHLLGGVGEDGGGGDDGVLQQPVGLVRAERGVFGDDPLGAADPDELGEGYGSSHGPGSYSPYGSITTSDGDGRRPG